MGIIIKKPIGASKVYDDLEIENKLLSNLKDQQQEGIKEGGSTNKYFTGITGSLPGELGQVFNPEGSDVKGTSGYGNSSIYNENNSSIQKPIGASNFTSSKFTDNSIPSLDDQLGTSLEDFGLGGGNQYALQTSVSYPSPSDSEIQKPLGASDFYSSGSGGYTNVKGTAVPSSYEALSDLTPNVVSPNGNPQYGLDINKVYAAPPILNSGPLSSIFENPIDFATYTTQQLEEASDNQRVGPNISAQNGIIDFRKNLRGNSFFTNIRNPNLFPEPEIEYNSNKKLELRVNLGDPGNPYNKNLTKYSAASASPSSFDIINSSAIYQSENATYSGDNNDLVKFVIGSMDGTNPNQQVFMHFRAFLGSISDNYTGNWDSVNYVGRGENFYNYTGFDRKVSLSFTVAAQSKAELAPMYRKLNFLASNLAPDYSEYGYMRGPLVTLTVGGYFYNQPGFITGLTYEMSEETPWEIGINDNGGFDDSVKELTHVIKVSSFAFTPIHTFPVRKQTNNYGGTGGKVTEYGRERYIALDAGHNNLYGPVYSSPTKDANNNVPDPTPIKTTPPVGTVPQSTQPLAVSTTNPTAVPATTTANTQGGTGTTGNTGAGQFNWLQK